MVFLSAFIFAQAITSPLQTVPDVPELHWIYDNFARLKKLDMLNDFPFGRGNYKPLASELAYSTVRTSMNVCRKVELLTEDIKSFPDMEVTPEFLKQLESTIPPLIRTVKMFEKVVPKYVSAKELTRALERADAATIKLIAKSSVPSVPRHSESRANSWPTAFR